MTLGQLIREARDKLGMTQSQAAILLGYQHKSSIAKIEADKNSIPRDKVYSFSKVFDIPLEQLVEANRVFLMPQWDDDAEKMREKLMFENNIKITYGKEVYELLSVFEHLNKAGKQLVIDHATDILNYTKSLEVINECDTPTATDQS